MRQKSERISPIWVGGYHPFSAACEENAQEDVAPHVGAWIETDGFERLFEYLLSPLM